MSKIRSLGEHPLSVTNDIQFIVGDNEVLRLCENGDIYVNGNLAENDTEVVEALRIFIQGQYII